MLVFWDILVLINYNQNFIQQIWNIIGKDRIAGFANYSNNDTDDGVEVRIQMPINILFTQEIL